MLVSHPPDFLLTVAAYQDSQSMHVAPLLSQQQDTLAGYDPPPPPPPLSMDDQTFLSVAAAGGSELESSSSSDSPLFAYDPALYLEGNSDDSSPSQRQQSEAKAPPKKRKRTKTTKAQASAACSTAIGVPPQPKAGKLVMIAGGIMVAIDSEEDLLRLNCEQIEQLLEERKASHDPLFTPEDEKRIRKMRRLIKNREYAQQSRNKKKQYVGGIEKELEAAHAEAQSLREQNATLAAKNVELEREVSRLKELLRAHSVSPDVHTEASKSSSGFGSTAAAVSVGACLLAVAVLGLFFGQFFLPSSSIRLFGMSSPGDAISGGLVIPTGRTLMSTPDSALYASGIPSMSHAQQDQHQHNLLYDISGAKNHEHNAQEYWQWQLQRETAEQKPPNNQQAPPLQTLIFPPQNSTQLTYTLLTHCA